MDIRRSGESPNQSKGGGEGKKQQTNNTNNSNTGIVGPMLVIFALIILAVAGIYVFGGDNDSANSTTTSEVSGPVARVGGEPIEAQAFNDQISARRQATTSRSAQQFQSLSETQQRERVLNNLINQELLRQSAVNAGVSVSDSEVDERLESQIEQIGGESEFEQRLSEINMTREEVRDDLRQQMLLTEYVSENVGTTTDEEVQQRYNQLSDQQLQQYSQAINRGSTGTSTGTPSLEDIRPILERQISVQKQQQGVRQLLQEARNSIDVEVLLDGVSYPPEAQQPQTQPQPQQQPGSQPGPGQQQQPQPDSDTEATTDGESAEQEADASATGTETQ